MGSLRTLLLGPTALMAALMFTMVFRWFNAPQAFPEKALVQFSKFKVTANSGPHPANASRAGKLLMLCEGLGDHSAVSPGQSHLPSSLRADSWSEVKTLAFVRSSGQTSVHACLVDLDGRCRGQIDCKDDDFDQVLLNLPIKDVP